MPTCYVGPRMAATWVLVHIQTLTRAGPRDVTLSAQRLDLMVGVYSI